MSSRHIFYFINVVLLCFTSIFCNAQGDSPQLIRYTSSECEEFYFGNRHNIQNRILNHTITKTSHIYNIIVATNCERTAQGEIAMVNDTLKLRYHNFIKVSEETIKINDSITEVKEVFAEELVECDCAYELMYEISNLKSEPKVVTLNDEIIKKTKHKYKVRRDAPKFDIINNDTINLIDIYGLKQKSHLAFRTDGKLLYNIYYVDNEPISGMAKISYDSKGFDRIELHKADGKYSKRKYYKNGKLFKICDTKGAFDDDTNCIFAE